MVQALEALHGNSPLFALRMTHLGDGNSLVAATWVHYVADGDSLRKLDTLTALHCYSTMQSHARQSSMALSLTSTCTRPHRIRIHVWLTTAGICSSLELLPQCCRCMQRNAR